MSFPRIRHGFNSRIPLSADVAQLVEQCFRKAKVVGSIPTIGSRCCIITILMPTRLERHEAKKLRSRVMTLIVLLGIFVIFMITIGLPLLINGSVFIGNLFGGKRESERNAQQLGDFSVNEIPIATNSAEIIVSGTVENLKTLEVYLNGDKADELDVENEEEFSERIDGLRSGDNEIYFVGKVNKSSASKKSQVYSIAYRNEKPKLEISEPQDNHITPRDEITVKGSTNQNVTVTVNDAPVITDASGNFQTSVKLKEGENKIKVLVQDSAGNTDSKEITVKYEK